MAFASGMNSVARRVAPSMAEWVSGKYTRNPKARRISAGPTLVHQAILGLPFCAAASSSKIIIAHEIVEIGGSRYLFANGFFLFRHNNSS